jgi:hypothetical protein
MTKSKNQAAPKGNTSTKFKLAAGPNRLTSTWVGVWKPSAGEERLIYDRDTNRFFLETANERGFFEGTHEVSLKEAYAWWIDRSAEGSRGRLQAYAGAPELLALVLKALETKGGAR